MWQVDALAANGLSALGPSTFHDALRAWPGQFENEARVSLGAAAMAFEAMLFDLDGTLIATNDLHVDAWMAAFASLDHVVGRDLIEREIGKGGDLLVPTLLGSDVEEREGESLRERHKKEWQKRARHSGISWINGAETLLHKVRDAGLRTALATSSSGDDIHFVEEIMGIKMSDYFDVISSSDVAKPTKPSPNIAIAACERLAIDPLQAGFVGDSIFDGKAAVGAGLSFFGVNSGFASPAMLRECGARFIAADAGALASDLSRALEAGSRTRISLQRSELERMMSEAIEIAARAGDAHRPPVGAALFDTDGRRISVARDESQRGTDPTAHAPMIALRRAFAEPRSEPCILASTVEPCVMCLGAAIQSNVDVVLYALSSQSKSVERLAPPPENSGILPRIRGGIGAEAAGVLGGVSLKRALET